MMVPEPDKTEQAKGEIPPEAVKVILLPKYTLAEAGLMLRGPDAAIATAASLILPILSVTRTVAAPGDAGAV